MTDQFADRHIGTDSVAQLTMLETVGYDSVDALMDAAVPTAIRLTEGGPTTIPAPATEREALAELRALAAHNTVRRSLLGLGYYDTITPAVIQRNVLENPSWYTAYTPYQPEISQGRLEALINFQTMVTELTGMHTATASMLDEGTAVVEGMLLARRASGSTSNVFVIDSDLFPQTKALLRGRAEAVDIQLVELDLSGLSSPKGVSKPDLPESFGVALQYPGASGRLWNPASVVEASHAHGGLAVVAADLLALTLVSAPGEFGADITVGTTQRFGVPMGFGGPHAGYLAVREGLERQLPGRLVGVSVDADGYPAYRLTLQTREQHIRREKATSNICTAQVLLAVMASMYAVYHGPGGLTRIAREVAQQAAGYAAKLRVAEIPVEHDNFFDTLTIHVPGRATEVVAAARDRGILLHTVDRDRVSLSFDEVSAERTTSGALPPIEADLDEVFGIAGGRAFGDAAIPSGLRRTSDFLSHPVFNTHHSETGMMRYLKYLADKDYALDRGMIPLGSCTMKLNAATE
ncbi:MAG TPA: glycine dehydrogenase (aminomethyl-transferring), partial [Pseudolysinimonas sp.]